MAARMLPRREGDTIAIRSIVLDESQTLAGDPVLPGFSVAIKTLFEELP
jgi:hypothetical protein